MEDEPLLRKLISAYLVAAGHVVRVAVDGLDALEKLRAGLPDLIISDLNMPRMSGSEFLEVVRSRLPQIPVIVISADASGELPEGLAADAYFHKNGSGFEQLLEIISGLTRNPPRRTPPLHSDSKPVQARWDGYGQYVLDCRDCMRVFSVPRAPYLDRADKWTTCVHCRRVVQFQAPDGDPQSLAGPLFKAANPLPVLNLPASKLPHSPRLAKLA